MLDERPFEDALEFLDAISHRSEWGTEWCWRGHGDSTWQLLPTIHRPHEVRRLLKATRSYEGDVLWTHVVNLEVELLATFIALANHGGLYLPPAVVQGYLDAETDHSWCREQIPNWLPKDLEPIAAVAQHYGLPTRLLDWTAVPKIGALFAAEDAVRLCERGRHGGRLALYGIQMESVRKTTDVKIVACPTYENTNIVAQRGFFTMYSGVRMPSVHAPGMRNPIEAAQHIAGYLRGLFAPFDPAPLDERVHTVKLTLPWSESDKLIWALRRDGIASEALFPGFGGAARAALVINMARQHQDPGLMTPEALGAPRS